MSERRVTCVHCGSSMEEGYVADRGHHNMESVANWIADEPEVHWYGVKTKGHAKIPLSASRCVKCGYVEFRAVP